MVSPLDDFSADYEQRLFPAPLPCPNACKHGEAEELLTLQKRELIQKASFFSQVLTALLKTRSEMGQEKSYG